MKSITWGEKVDMILMYPNITLKQIRSLLSIGQPSAIVLRDKALKLAEKLGEGKTVVTILPDTAERYFSTPLFNS